MAQSSSTPAKNPSPEDVRAFLQQLHEKMAYKAPLSLVFLDSRDKNRQALPRLLELGVTPPGRRLIIEGLVATDYCEKLLEDQSQSPVQGDLWVFGKHIKGEPYYIKLQLGAQNRTAICVSFHPAESKLRFPFKR